MQNKYKNLFLVKNKEKFQLCKMRKAKILYLVINIKIKKNNQDVHKEDLKEDQKKLSSVNNTNNL